MKFTQCTRARLVDANFAEAPGPLAHSSLHPPCSFLSFRGRSLVLVLPLMVSHHLDGLGILNSHQPCQLQVFPHHRSFGRLFARAPLPSTRNFVCSPPLDILLPFFAWRCSANCGSYFWYVVLNIEYQFHSCACQHHGTYC